MEKTLTVNGMHCEKCVARVKKALEKIDGVESADVSLENNSAVVTLSADVADEALVEAVNALDFEAAIA